MRRRLAVLLLLALAACGDPAGLALPRGGVPPTALEIGWSGYGVGSTRIWLVGDRLHYTYVRPDHRPGRPIDTAVVAVSPARWAAFWEAGEVVGLGTWPRACTDPNVVDGGGMSVEIVHDGRRLSLSTSNASPGRGGRCARGETTPEETAFHQAVAALVGLPFPGAPVRAAELPSEGAPYELRVEAHHLPARHDLVWLRGDTLVVVRRSGTGAGVRADTARVVPTADDWRAFWRAARASGVVGWPETCRDPAVADGTRYLVALDSRLGFVHAVAENAYPQPDARCVTHAGTAAQPDAPASLVAFLDAVAALVGPPFS